MAPDLASRIEAFTDELLTLRAVLPEIDRRPESAPADRHASGLTEWAEWGVRQGPGSVRVEGEPGTERFVATWRYAGARG